jgi:drug/metabolite transporter (DMT)-like permease
VEFFWLLRIESVSMANSFAYVVPIAVFLGWLIFRELITFQAIIATCIILIGVALMVSDSKSLSSPKRTLDESRK